MPTLDVSEVNVVLSVLGMLSDPFSNSILTALGAFTILYALPSVKIKNVWYLGEACKSPTPVLSKPC